MGGKEKLTAGWTDLPLTLSHSKPVARGECAASVAQRHVYTRDLVETTLCVRVCVRACMALNKSIEGAVK